MEMRFVSTSVPRERIQSYIADRYRITQILFKAGESMTMEYTGGGLVKDICSRHMQPTGVRICESNALPPMCAGAMTQHDTYEIPAGVHARIATEDTELWCLRDKDSEAADVGLVDCVKLGAGDILELVAKDRVFLAYGQIAVEEQEFDAPRLLIVSGQRSIAPINGVAYLFKWSAPLE